MDGLPKNIQFTLKSLCVKDGENLKVCYFKHKITNLSVWFLLKERQLLEANNYSLKQEGVNNKDMGKYDKINNFIPAQLLKRVIDTISIGYYRKLILKGVGFKAKLVLTEPDGFHSKESENYQKSVQILSIKIGKKQPLNCIIPENVIISIEGNIINAWSPNITLIDNMFFKILKSKVIKKGSMVVL